MKRIISILICLILALSSVTVGAEGDIRVTYNGNEIVFDLPPIMSEDRVLVPIRAVAEEMGALVIWDDTVQDVVITTDENRVLFHIGSTVMYKDGNPIEIDVPAQIISGRTLVPVRAAAEALNCFVDWNDTEQTVNIWRE